MTGYLYAIISDIVVDNNNRMRKKHNNRVVKIVSKMAKIRSKSMAAIKGKLFSGKEKKRFPHPNLYYLYNFDIYSLYLLTDQIRLEIVHF